MERDSKLVNTYIHTHTIYGVYTKIGNGLFIFSEWEKSRKRRKRNPLDLWSEAFTLKATPKAPQYIFSYFIRTHTLWRFAHFTVRFVSLLLLRLLLRLRPSQLMCLLLLELSSTDVFVELGGSETTMFAVVLRLKTYARRVDWTSNEYTHTHIHTYAHC